MPACRLARLTPRRAPPQGTQAAAQSLLYVATTEALLRFSVRRTAVVLRALCVGARITRCGQATRLRCPFPLRCSPDALSHHLPAGRLPAGARVGALPRGRRRLSWHVRRLPGRGAGPERCGQRAARCQPPWQRAGARLGCGVASKLVSGRPAWWLEPRAICPLDRAAQGASCRPRCRRRDSTRRWAGGEPCAGAGCARRARRRTIPSGARRRCRRRCAVARARGRHRLRSPPQPRRGLRLLLRQLRMHPQPRQRCVWRPEPAESMGPPQPPPSCTLMSRSPCRRLRAQSGGICAAHPGAHVRHHTGSRGPSCWHRLHDRALRAGAGGERRPRRGQQPAQQRPRLQQRQGAELLRGRRGGGLARRGGGAAAAAVVRAPAAGEHEARGHARRAAQAVHRRRGPVVSVRRHQRSVHRPHPLRHRVSSRCDGDPPARVDALWHGARVDVRGRRVRAERAAVRHPPDPQRRPGRRAPLPPRRACGRAGPVAGARAALPQQHARRLAQRRGHDGAADVPGQLGRRRAVRVPGRGGHGRDRRLRRPRAQQSGAQHRADGCVGNRVGQRARPRVPGAPGPAGAAVQGQQHALHLRLRHALRGKAAGPAGVAADHHAGQAGRIEQRRRALCGGAGGRGGESRHADGAAAAAQVPQARRGGVPPA